MESVQSRLITQVINSTLADKPIETTDTRTSTLANSLISSENSLLRAPVKQDFFTGIIRVLRSFFCSDKTRVYLELKDSLSELAKGLQSGEITYTVDDAAREKTLRTYYHGNGSEVFAKVAADLHVAIKNLGLSAAKTQKLDGLVALIENTLTKTATFREEFQDLQSEADVIEHCINQLKDKNPDLSNISSSLTTLASNINAGSALGEKLHYARGLLEMQKSLQPIKESLEKATTIQDLFSISAEAIEECALDPELKELFSKNIEEKLKLCIGKTLHSFKKESLALVREMEKNKETFFELNNDLNQKFEKITLPDTLDLPKELAGAKEFYTKTAASTEKVQVAYLRAYKTQLEYEATRFTKYIEKEPNLERLALCKQNMDNLKAIVDHCEHATSSKTSPEVVELVDAIRGQLGTLEHTLVKRINEQAIQQQKELLAQLAQLNEELQKNQTLITFGNKEHTVAQITPPPAELPANTTVETPTTTPPEVEQFVQTLQGKLNELEETITSNIHSQSTQQKKELQAQITQLTEKIEQTQTQLINDKKEPLLVQITKEPKKKYSVTALGVALSALKWVPIVGLPAAELGEALVDKTPNFVEAGISTCLTTALLTGYVAYSGINPMSQGGLIWSGLKVAPLLTPTAVAYVTRQLPPANLLPRPMALALGMVTAGATAYVFYRGPANIAWDIGSYVLTNVPGAAYAVGSAVGSAALNTGTSVLSSGYNAVTNKVSELGPYLIREWALSI